MDQQKPLLIPNSYKNGCDRESGASSKSWVNCDGCDTYLKIGPV